MGPIYRDGKQGEAEQLASCHRESLQLADAHALKSVAFPAISTGAFDYPVTDAARIAASSAVKTLAAANHVSMVRFVLFDVATLKTYLRAAEELSRSGAASPFRIEKVHS